MTYDAWRLAYPEAAAKLEGLLVAEAHPPLDVNNPGRSSEARAQQATRMDIARQGAMSWRNNVGATKAEETHVCPACSYRFKVVRQPVRYGLGNDSAKLNANLKSHDLILAIPRVITPAMVGTTIAQFGSVECKREGWVFNSKDPREVAQAKWGFLLTGVGAFSAFSTGKVRL